MYVRLIYYFHTNIFSYVLHHLILRIVWMNKYACKHVVVLTYYCVMNEVLHKWMNRMRLRCQYREITYLNVKRYYQRFLPNENNTANIHSVFLTPLIIALRWIELRWVCQTNAVKWILLMMNHESDDPVNGRKFTPISKNNILNAQSLLLTVFYVEYMIFILQHVYHENQTDWNSNYNISIQLCLWLDYKFIDIVTILKLNWTNWNS